MQAALARREYGMTGIFATITAFIAVAVVGFAVGDEQEQALALLLFCQKVAGMA